MNYDSPAKVATQLTAADRLEERLGDLRTAVNYLETVVAKLVDLPPRPPTTMPPQLGVGQRPPFFPRIESASDQLCNLTEEIRTLTHLISDRL